MPLGTRMLPDVSSTINRLVSSAATSRLMSVGTGASSSTWMVKVVDALLTPSLTVTGKEMGSRSSPWAGCCKGMFSVKV